MERSDSQLLTKYFIHAVMVILGLLAVLPIYILLINATRSTEQINSGIVIVPGKDAFVSSSKTIEAKWDAADESGTARYLDMNIGRTLKEEKKQKDWSY